MFVWIINSADDALLHLPQGGVDAQSGYQKSVVIQKWLEPISKFPTAVDPL